MIRLATLLFLLTGTGLLSCSNGTPPAVSTQQSVHDFSLKDIDGKVVQLADFRGKVLVLVNVASKCGYTPQYEGLQKFYEEYQSKGVVVLGFPANDFLGQEPGTEAEIKSFCQRNYGVTFPMFSKIHVKGKEQHPLYAYLTAQLDTKVSWNFNKFLVDKSGKPVQHFGSDVEPNSAAFRSAVAALL